MVTDNDLMWKQVSGLTDSNYSCTGDSKLFYVLQKRLIVEMIMDVLALNERFPTWKMHVWACPRCNSMCLRAQQAEMSAITTSRTSLLTSTNRRNIMKGKAFGRKDGDDMRTKWYCFNDVADLLCAQCHAEGAQCINCHANGLIEQNTMYKGADRPNIMKRFFAECSLVLSDINELECVFDGDKEAFVQHLIVNLFNKKFAKELSQIGGITLDKDSFADYFRSSNGKQLWVDKLSYVARWKEGEEDQESENGLQSISQLLLIVGGKNTICLLLTHEPTHPRGVYSVSLTSYPTSGRSCQNTDQCWKPRS